MLLKNGLSLLMISIINTDYNTIDICFQCVEIEDLELTRLLEV